MGIQLINLEIQLLIILEIQVQMIKKQKYDDDRKKKEKEDMEKMYKKKDMDKMCRDFDDRVDRWARAIEKENKMKMMDKEDDKKCEKATGEMKQKCASMKKKKRL